jgi:hypothetical protein
VAYTHRVQYTKSILDGPSKGSQRYAFTNLPRATRAVQVALELREGIHRDPWTGEAFTAHCIDIVSIEREVPGLVDSAYWDRFDAADMAYDLSQELR